MSDDVSGGEHGPSGLCAAELLAESRAAQRAAWDGEIRLLRAAGEWAAMHPEETLDTEYAFSVPGLEDDVPVAGPGAPTMGEFAISEFGAFLGISTPAAKALIGAAVELQHRLPRTWRLVVGTSEVPGRMAPWQAKLVARATIARSLTPEAVDWVDRQVAILGGCVGTTRLEKVVDEAVLRFMTVTDGLDPELGGGVIPDRRNVTLYDQHIASDGTLHIEADLELADAFDLDHVVQHRAEESKRLGCTDSLDVRRARALGDLARTQTALDLAIDSQRIPTSPEDLPNARHLDLTIHLTGTVDDTGNVTVDPVATLERHGGIVLLRRTVEDWCRSSRTEVRVLPVLDLNVPRSNPGYRPSALLKRQVTLRDGTCYFPWCERPAAACDLDHVAPYDTGPNRTGPSPEGDPPQTRDTNLAPACRKHHRVKTHGRWRVTSPRPGTYVWTSPRGDLYLRDARGTTAL